MEIAVKKLESCWQEITITVPAEEAEKDYRKLLGKYKSKVNIPGFRKGKAPLSLIERNYGEYLREEFLQEQAERYYVKAITKEDIHPVSEAQPVKTEWQHNEDFVAVIKFEVMPEIEIKEYKDLKVEFEPRKLQDTEVDGMIKYLQENMATSEDVETEIEEGHIAYLDLTREDDELNFQREVEVGQNVYNEELNKNLLGKKAGDTFSSTIFDEKEDAPEEEKKFQGKVFTIKIEKVEKRELPEVNDDFAKDMGHESVEDMRKKLAEDIESRINSENTQARNNAIMSKLVELNPIEIPQSMVVSYAKQLAQDAVKQYNIELNQAMQLYMGLAEFNLKSFNLQNKLQEILDLQITDEYKEGIIAEAAANMKLETEKYKELYKKQLESPEFEQSVMDRLLMDHLVENTTFIKPEPKEEVEETEETQED